MPPSARARVRFARVSLTVAGRPRRPASLGAGGRGGRARCPDIPGFVTLKADFHLHSVFSDGEVWPTVHVREALRDGLDALSLTEHLEYRPHKADLAGGACACVRSRAAPGRPAWASCWCRASRSRGPVPGAKSRLAGRQRALQRARFPPTSTPWTRRIWPRRCRARRRREPSSSGTIPGSWANRPKWFPHVGALFEAGLFSGIEVVNGDQFYPEALRVGGPTQSDAACVQRRSLADARALEVGPAADHAGVCAHEGPRRG